MTAKKYLNSAVRILEHAQEEGPKFGDPQKRAADYLATTKTPEELQDMKQALLDLL